MTDEQIDAERHEYHGWPIRVICEYQIGDAKFAARSFVTPAGQHERAAPGTPCLESVAIEARARALKAARRYIDSILVD
jgi:hypothetical protein